MATTKSIQNAYKLARETYAALGVDAEAALRRLRKVAISLHCWQGDDVGGFENAGGELGGGLAVTGSYPGKARTPEELRADLVKTYSLIPGRHRLALHAIYAETGGQRVPRNEITPAHFQDWIGWAKANRLGLDFNPTCFSHPKAADGFTLSHQDKGIRQFWIEHCIASRKIGAAMGQAQGNPCVTNLWIPDGYKDTPVDPKARGNAWPNRWTPFLRRRSAPNTIWIRWNQNCLAWGRKVMWWVRRSFIMGTPSATKSCSAWIPATFIPRRASRTKSLPCWNRWMKFFSTSAAACAGTATMW